MPLLVVLENRSLQGRLDELVGASEIIGESPAIRRVLALVKQVAPTSATGLIQGESGTGKELVARALHEGSPGAVGGLKDGKASGETTLATASRLALGGTRGHRAGRRQRRGLLVVFLGAGDLRRNTAPGRGPD